MSSESVQRHAECWRRGREGQATFAHSWQESERDTAFLERPLGQGSKSPGHPVPLE